MLNRRTLSFLGLAALGAAGCGSEGASPGVTSTAGTTSTADPPRPPPNVIDLVVDANRDGLARAEDKEDQDRETDWDATVGASFIANLDDDDNDGKRDCEDEIINGDADLWDIATFLAAPWPDAIDGARGIVKVDQEAAESVRIFKKGLDGGWSLVLGSLGPCTSPTDCTYVLEHSLGAEEVRAGVTFGIEGRRFKGMPLPTLPPDDDVKKNAWTGYVDLSYEIQDGAGAAITSDANPDGIDRARMRVAPWVMAGSLDDHDTIYSSKASGAFVNGNTVAANAAGVAYTPYGTTLALTGGWTDIWTEDFFQTGWTGFPGENGAVRGMRIANARPWGRPPTSDDDPNYLPIKWLLGNPDKSRPPAFLGPDRGVAVFYDPKHEGYGHTQDSHGAHDLIPGYEGQPMGRIITSTKVFTETKEFYAAQEVQGPPIIIDTSWLAVEHVDEFFHWVPADTPRGWKLLYASPALMLQMLEKLQADGHGSATMHKGWGGFFEMTVKEALANVELNAWSQTAELKIQGHIDTLKAETGITDADLVAIPTWFEDLSSKELVAWNPGMVNMRMMGNVADVAKPWGPLIGGVDPFEADIRARLGTAAEKLGQKGQGLEIYFTNDWYYHSSLGEVHCGTNAIGGAPFNTAFWWESGK